MTSVPGSSSQNPLDNSTEWVAKHISAYVETDGRDGSVLRGAPLLLLTTNGAKSGVWRRTALIFGEHSGSYLIVASMGGAPRHPSWYVNLQENPEVFLQVYGRKFHAAARTATPEEKPELWAEMVAIFPQYAEYQTKTERDIPVVILEPIAGEDAR